jgi:transposase
VSTDLDLRSPRQARWLFLRRPEHLTDGQRDAVERLRQHEELDMIYRLVQRFTTILRERLDDQLAQWVEDIVSSGIRELVSFAEGLRRDWQAVEAGVRLPWSQGQTEGQVNRLKLIKRQMYGRANFDLLRIRVLHHT